MAGRKRDNEGSFQAVPNSRRAVRLRISDRGLGLPRYQLVHPDHPLPAGPDARRPSAHDRLDRERVRRTQSDSVSMLAAA
jgi:hypothetical protein